MLENYHKINHAGLPYIVADDRAVGIVGYCYVSPFNATRLGYRYTLELSLYCHPDHLRLGLGKRLLLRMLEILGRPEAHGDWFEGNGLLEHRPRQLLAVMAVDSEGPGGGWKLRDWYVNHGFAQVGHMKEVGWKLDRWIDTVYLQLTLR